MRDQGLGILSHEALGSTQGSAPTAPPPPPEGPARLLHQTAEHLG